MLTLIKREIEDHISYFVGAFVASATLVFTLLYLWYNYQNEETPIISFSLGIPFIIFITIGLYFMGGSQMSIDRNKKVSAFLSTLPVSRNKILLARITAGLLAILILLVPPAITAQVLLNTFKPAYPVYSYFTVEIFSSLFLMAFAIYSIGLMSGFHSNKIYQGIGIIMCLILLPLIFIKGFGPQLSIILLIFIAASLTYTWKKFIKAPLI